MLLTREPLNEASRDIVDLVLAGIAVEPPSASQPHPVLLSEQPVIGAKKALPASW